MFMKTLLPFALCCVLFSFSCGSETDKPSGTADTMSAKDSLKKKLTEDLPPSTGIEQFEWIYSSFVAAAITDARRFNVFIHPDDGLWIIRSTGAMPEMVNVKNILRVKANNGDSLIPMNRDKMYCTPVQEQLPKPDCETKTFWSRNGCFTSEANTFSNEKIWDAAGLTESDSKKVEELAGRITRVVINTEMNMRFYFTEVNGTWYLTFLDMRVPCSA